MKNLFKVLLVMFGLFVLGIAAIFYFTSDLVTTADEFFLAAKNNDMNKVNTYLSDEFKAATSEEELNSFLKNNNINKYQEANWDSRSIDGRKGDLAGSLTLSSGDILPITLGLVKKEEGWKVNSINKNASTTNVKASTKEIPTEDELVSLVRDSMYTFGECVNNKSMSNFHQYISVLWRNQISVDELDNIFKVFYDAGIDLTLLKDFSPQFDKMPEINENGVLSITGHYPTQPNQVYFDQQFIYEGMSWKLFGFSTNVK